MVPQTAAAVVLFLLIIVPGIAFEMLRQTRRPSFEQTTLEELGRIILASLGFSGASVVLLTLISSLESKIVLDLPLVADRGAGWYWSRHPGRVIWTIALEVLIATAIALLAHRSLNHPERKGWATRLLAASRRSLRHEVGEQVERFPIWRTFFRDIRPQGAATKLTVLKKDGTMITGVLAGYTANGSSDDRDLALSQPIEILRAGEIAAETVPPGWPIMIIAASEVAEIFVTWPPKLVG